MYLRIYPAKYIKYMLEPPKKAGSFPFQREFSFMELCIQAKGEPMSLYGLPPHDVLLYQPSACP